jgi:integrating conjugative element membrane protein (TIGR03747 family)
LASRQASFHQQGIAGTLLSPLKCMGIGLLLLIGMLAAAWIIDGVFVFQVWPEGIARLQSLLNQDMARTRDLSCWCGDLQKLAAGTANGLYRLIFGVSGLHEMGERFAESRALSIPDTVVRNAYLANYGRIQLAMLSTQLFGVRLATLLAGVPLFALYYAVALADGLAERAIRRVRGGRESGSLYHRAKYLQRAVMVMTTTLFLLWPSSINFPAMAGIASGVAAVLARVQWSYYKKHL